MHIVEGRTEPGSGEVEQPEVTTHDYDRAVADNAAKLNTLSLESNRQEDE